MRVFLVTGVSGSGKTAVAHELVGRGYGALDADAHLACWIDHDGWEVSRPDDADADWFARHRWQWDLSKLAALRRTDTSVPLFVCGNADNDAEVFDLFDGTFLLWVDEQTMLRRVGDPARSNDFGQSEVERDLLISWRPTAQVRWSELGATVIDATQELIEVVDSILSHLRATGDTCQSL